MTIANTFSQLAIVAACSGCASQMLSDEKLRAHTSPLIGVSAAELTILNRNEQGTNTYYTARTKSGAEYHCSINGGGVLAAGMVQGGQCAKTPEISKPTAPTGQERAKPVGATTKPDSSNKPVKK
ncbi:MAG TPA: hypothetical protein VE934_08740 [Polaromonas sp.]|uniref:hypothetical protein n=1 Tax=Polaromonas sp. TaxID=1869339 RepID=UPI002D4E73DE|nr:hypothetical protein [Polaromonas sp.]HYW57035.1 hypothetical protein [Polaromonas sp.]